MDFYQAHIAQISPISVNNEASANSPTGVNYDEPQTNGLFKLLEDLQWKKAGLTLKQFPNEAKVWATKNAHSQVGWRRLPIHEACIRQPTADIIYDLLICFPTSAQETDNFDRTPLHCAIINNANIDVIYLILDAHYNATHTEDFFGKMPKDYIPGSDDAIAVALEKNMEYISLAASNARSKLEASISHIAVNNHCDNGYISSKRDTKLYQASTMESLLDEELAQARVEADSAYSQRDIAIAKNDAMLIQNQELQNELQRKQEIIDNVEGLADRNRNLSKLLNYFEMQNQTLHDEIKRDKEAADAKSKGLAEKNQLEKDKLKATIGTLAKKLTDNMRIHLDETVYELKQSEEIDSRDKSIFDMKNEIQRLMNYKCSAEEKMESLEEMVDVYKFASKDLQLKCIYLDDKIKKSTANSQIAKLEEDLESSKRAKISLEKDVSLLTSYNIINNDKIEKLGCVVKNYQIKVGNLEEGYFTMTDQLIERTRLLYHAVDKKHFTDTV